jgi:hypothetical protein
MSGYDGKVHGDYTENIADYLLSEGVIVPPMRLRQTCYRFHPYRNDFDECRVSSITQKADGSFKIRLTHCRSKSVFEITPDKISKTVFLTREEAEKALERSEDDGT